MSNDYPSHYERIAIDFAEWVNKKKYMMDEDGTWWDTKTNAIIAESTADLLHVFQTQ